MGRDIGYGPYCGYGYWIRQGVIEHDDYQQKQHQKHKHDDTDAVGVPVGVHLQHGALHPPLKPGDEGEDKAGRFHLEARRGVRMFNIHRQIKILDVTRLLVFV